MYWNMALVGDFIRIPKNLVSWRQHKGQISVDRVESIKEVEHWFKKYFERNDRNSKNTAVRLESGMDAVKRL